MNEEKYIELLGQDYACALIHLVCLCTKGKKGKSSSYDLVFGFVEFFPHECATAPIETTWQTLGMKDYRLFYRRKKASVYEGIAFFLRTQEENPFTFIWDNKNTVKTGGLHFDSAIGAPYLSDYQKLPFISAIWGVARVQSLFPTSNQALVEILRYQNIAKWLEDRLCFNLVESYPELIGSMHCCLPNPIYRSCELRLVPANAAKPPQVQIHFTPREGRKIKSQSEIKGTQEDLTLYLLEKRSYGYAGGAPIQVPGKYFEIPLIGGDEKVGYIVYCSKRGLLGYSEFNSFVHTLHADIVITEGTKQYIFENESGDKQDIVETENKQLVSTITCGLDRFADDQVHDPGKRIRQILFNKEVQKKAQELGQFLCDNQEKSKDYVRKILNQAINKVIIIDPYFDPEGLFYYIKSIELQHIVPEVIVSAEGLKQEFKKQDKRDTKRQAPESPPTSSQNDEYVTEPVQSNADIFEKLLSNKEFENTLTISVMPGVGVFHDRFLIIDSQVWLSGNSLNSLGKRLSTIIRLPDGSEVLNALEKLRVEELKPFSDWLTEHRQAKLSAGEGVWPNKVL